MKKLTKKELAAQLKIAREEIASHASKSPQAAKYNMKKESIKTIEKLLVRIYEELELDEDRLQGFFKMSRKSEYGRVPELLSKIASTYNWPIDDVSDIKEISDKQEQIIDILEGVVDHDLLMDLKESKGSHSFMDKNTFEVIEANEPEYEDYEFLIYSLAGSLDLSYVDFKLDEDKWEKNEIKAQDKVAKDIHAADEALRAHELLMSATI